MPRICGPFPAQPAWPAPSQPPTPILHHKDRGRISATPVQISLNGAGLDRVRPEGPRLVVTGIAPCTASRVGAAAPKVHRWASVDPRITIHTQLEAAAMPINIHQVGAC